MIANVPLAADNGLEAKASRVSQMENARLHGQNVFSVNLEFSLSWESLGINS